MSQSLLLYTESNFRSLSTHFKVAETYLYVRWLCFWIMFLAETGLTDFYDFLKVASFSMLSVPKIIEIG